MARPALTPAERANARSGPVVVAGMFRTASGVGQSARSCADALQEEGIDHLCVDLSEPFRQIDLDNDVKLRTMPDAAVGTLILHANGPEVLPALHHLGLYGAKRWRVIGCWVWELETAPASWVRAVSQLSEIWAPSKFCADAFKRLSSAPVRVVPYRIKAPVEIARKPAGKYALTMADGRSSLRRKNPAAAIRVFLDALSDREDWSLIVKTRNIADAPELAASLRDTARGHSRIKFLDASLSEAERWKLIAESAVMISMHRSEGFGLPVAEALSVGVPVIATGWSAVAEFAPPEYLVPFSIVPVADPGGPYAPYHDSHWAEPDERAASLLLKRIAAGELGSARLRPQQSALRYAEALLTDPA